MHRLVVCALAFSWACLSTAAAIEPRQRQEDPPPTEQTTNRSERTSPTRRTPVAPQETRINGVWMLGSNSSLAVFAEQRNLQRGRETTTLWTTWVNRQPDQGAKYVVRLLEFDCANRYFRSLSDTLYNYSGQVVSSFGASETDYIVPGSLGEIVLDAACQPLDRWLESAVLIPPRDSPVAYADHYFATGEMR